MRELRAGGHREHQNLLLPALKQWGDMGDVRGPNPTSLQCPQALEQVPGHEAETQIFPYKQVCDWELTGEQPLLKTLLSSCRAPAPPGSDFQPLGQWG